MEILNKTSNNHLSYRIHNTARHDYLLLLTFVENEAVTPVKSKFYIMHVDHVFKRRNENIENIFFKRLNN